MSGLKVLFERYVRSQAELFLALSEKAISGGVINCVNGFPINTPFVVPTGCTIDFGWHTFPLSAVVTLKKGSFIRNGFLNTAPVVAIVESTTDEPAVITNIFMKANGTVADAIIIDPSVTITGGFIQNVSVANYQNGLVSRGYGKQISGLNIKGLSMTEVAKGVTLDATTTNCNLELNYTPSPLTSLYAVHAEGPKNTIGVSIAPGAFSTSSSYQVKTNTTNKVSVSEGTIIVNLAGDAVVNPLLGIAFNPMTGILSF